jgi:hypothetical protein
MFWTIKHGIKMSAIPAWGKSHDDEAIWNMVAFVRKAPGMSAPDYRASPQKSSANGVTVSITPNLDSERDGFCSAFW